MHRVLAATLLVVSVVMMVGISAADRMQPPSQQVQQQLIALDKQWGEAGTDKAVLNKILSDKLLALGQKGEAEGKKEQIAAISSTPSSGYVADEHKFEMLTPDVVVMTHRGTSTTTEGGKPVKESHRSLHVFQRNNGNWQVVASAQVPIPQK
jgi:ketosteroid isomerase-like protein